LTQRFIASLVARTTEVETPFAQELLYVSSLILSRSAAEKREAATGATAQEEGGKELEDDENRYSVIVSWGSEQSGVLD
jgi:hypothetical protein